VVAGAKQDVDSRSAFPSKCAGEHRHYHEKDRNDGVQDRARSGAYKAAYTSTSRLLSFRLRATQATQLPPYSLSWVLLSTSLAVPQIP
jgi:hypothetical protein